jgi:hypothetical protein
MDRIACSDIRRTELTASETKLARAAAGGEVTERNRDAA